MSEIRTATLSNLAGTGPATLTGQSANKSWVNFDGTGTAAIRDSFNVASLTDTGTGRYTITYTSAMDAALTYGITSCGNIGATNIYGGQNIATAFGTYITNYAGTADQDNAYVMFAVQGDLA